MAKKKRDRRETIRSMTVDLASLDLTVWEQPDAPAEAADGEEAATPAQTQSDSA